MKFFVPDSEKGDPSTVLNSDDYLRTIYILRSDLYNALVIETILRTAESRFPSEMRVTNEYSVADFFLRVESVFMTKKIVDGTTKIQVGYITERLSPIVDEKFVYHDLKKVFKKLIELGEKHRAWVIHGDVKIDNILVGGSGRSMLFDYGMSASRIDFPSSAPDDPFISYSCCAELDPARCMHIDSMFLALDLGLDSMKSCKDPYAEVYKYQDEPFKIEKYLP
jgi:serine/threonine protein kinase